MNTNWLKRCVLLAGMLLGVNAQAAPTVAFIAPSAGQIFTVPEEITLTAEASYPGGTISKVEFFRDGIMIGTATSARNVLSLHQRHKPGAEILKMTKAKAFVLSGMPSLSHSLRSPHLRSSGRAYRDSLFGFWFLPAQFWQLETAPIIY
ncbi:MAG: hypothetical protein LBI31_04525 [Zoogloeaceae bacterium]|jgi:hypothetical protein|nr:hypothetical protein [Zoogloeaceae bacterium]